MYEVTGKPGLRPARTHMIHVRVQTGLLKAVEEAADRDGRTRSDWIRRAMTKEAKRQAAEQGAG